MPWRLVIAALCCTLTTSRILPIALAIREGEPIGFERFAVYSNRDQPGKFNSSITFSVQAVLPRLKNTSDTRILLAILPYSSLLNLTQASSPPLDFCKSSELDSENHIAVYSQQLEKEDNVTIVHYVEETELYDLVLQVCGGEVRLVGEIEVRNPFGYLPGETYPLFTFSFIALCAYGFLISIWTVLLYWYWQSAISLQKWYIPSVLVICALEEACYYASWSTLNTTGYSSRSLLIAVLMLNSLRAALARVLLLVVCMGYGITIPLLRRKCLIAFFGFLFFLLNSTYVLMLHIPHWFAVRAKVTHLIAAVLPLSVVNSCFYLWTFEELIRTIQKLKREHQEFKLRIFQKLVILLLVAIVFALLWFTVECYYRFYVNWEDYWQISWRFDAAWHVVFYVTVLGIVSLWRPTDQSKSLAFTLELRDMEDVSKSEIQKKQDGHQYQIGYEGESGA